MKNWILFTEKEYKRIWKKIYDDFKFDPSSSKFPSLKVPFPFITYDVSEWSTENYDELEKKALHVFQELTLPNEYVMALDWQHDCYWINAHLTFKRDEFGEWPIPIFPDGDYYFFIHKDFKWGYLGHPWEKSITVYGEELINAFEKQKPELFRKVLRNS